ncbi:thiol:disulfide interchange protein DsbA/DsbL [Acinetobacter rathckeae]|uniref:thiol:disulfide interchange protein DsbA/DsbL n=1 Tax=Acinetobacter rathckeae TaxID=2605272 RepID=UPI0018A337DE|nr:thiol:disulfide interchange protein DsbA/DsbL [Acinetobacter rathckeae]MBF7688820.1 thiol:disulfide interchange protein DsbA/DsbL [Acinetobacter rathckeae]MBF7696297.1 thiol:disulfide interchange protein DsbA/DsbL [Acinetobacter rathckeae]
MKKFIIHGFAATVMAFSVHAMAAEQFVAGKDYTVLKNPSPVTGGKILVREFFWYGCPHCFKLEPHMQTWLKSMPKDVTFLRTPAAMNPVWESGARTYYASELLNVRQKTHLPLMHAIHVDNQQIFDQASAAKFFTKYGVSESQFNNAYNSFAVSTQVAESNKLAQQYQLTGVPAVIVNGKYMIQGEDGKVTQVLNYLIEKERKAK